MVLLKFPFVVFTIYVTEKQGDVKHLFREIFQIKLLMFLFTWHQDGFSSNFILLCIPFYWSFFPFYSQEILIGSLDSLILPY